MIVARQRCPWAAIEAPAEVAMVAYHDDEWGVRVRGDIELFERLALESFQAGLSWATILRKRPTFREAFDGFDPTIVARYGEADRTRLLGDVGIVRNRAKIDATIGNAAALEEITRHFGSFDAYLVGVLGPRIPRQLPDAVMADIPARTAGSDALSADLRARGFRFVGSTITYAFMQSVGLVDDHLPVCFRYRGPA